MARQNAETRCRRKVKKELKKKLKTIGENAWNLYNKKAI